MGGRGVLIIAGLLAGAALEAAAQENPSSSAVPPMSACRFEMAGTGKVANILDGRTLVLDDGREVRLAAVEAPSLPGPGETSAQALTAAAVAKSALAALLAGETVELRQPTPATDRYGRILAHVYFTRDGIERSATLEMLAQGYARVSAHVGNAACAAELLSRERAARTAKLGLWASLYYGIVQAESGAELLAGRGRFTVVEGKVLSVRESGGTIYMNFGRRWSDAPTVTILKRHERIFAQAGLPPKSLQNRRLRVRGWVDERNGPRIEASHPEQIEIAELN
jgi:endonuclease YncB( thermonuclease family)